MVGLLTAEEELEDGEHARACEDHGGCADEQLGREQPGARVDVVEENRVHANQRMREPGKHKKDDQQRRNRRREPRGRG